MSTIDDIFQYLDDFECIPCSELEQKLGDRAQQIIGQLIGDLRIQVWEYPTASYYAIRREAI